MHKGLVGRGIRSPKVKNSAQVSHGSSAVQAACRTSPIDRLGVPPTFVMRTWQARIE